MTAYSSRYYDPPVRFRDVITRADIDTCAERGQSSLQMSEQSTITDEAREQAYKLGIAIHPACQVSPVAEAASLPMSTSGSAKIFSPIAGKAVSMGEPQNRVMTPVSSAPMIEAVVAELQSRSITPSVPLIEAIVSSVNAALGHAEH